MRPSGVYSYTLPAGTQSAKAIALFSEERWLTFLQPHQSAFFGQMVCTYLLWYYLDTLLDTLGGFLACFCQEKKEKKSGTGWVKVRDP